MVSNEKFNPSKEKYIDKKVEKLIELIEKSKPNEEVKTSKVEKSTEDKVN